MQHQSAQQPFKIEKVPKGIKRPLWSVVIPTYNCAHFLKETLKSVLSQDPGAEQMEILVVDDHSTQDDPEAVVKDWGKERVQFIQHANNVGKSANYAHGIAQAKGDYIHLLHGDDTVALGFYKKMEALFTHYPEAAAAFCQCTYINEQNTKIGATKVLASSAGILKDFEKDIAVWQLIQPPSIVFKRHVYETIGAYDGRLKYLEDWEFYVRAALQFKFAYTPEPLAYYRIFADNSSSRSAKGGARVATIYQVLDIMDSYIPAGLQKDIKTKRQQAVAVYCLKYIPQMMATKDLKGLGVFSKAFFRHNRSLRLVGRWLRFVVQYQKFLN